jgi:hypothetical protein
MVISALNWLCPILRLGFAAAFLLSATAGFGAQAQSGLLLGLENGCKNGNEPCAVPNRTLWIAPQSGRLQIMEIPDLIVPRKAGFWRVGIRTYCEADWSDDLGGKKTYSLNDRWFAKPVDERPVVGGLVPCPGYAQVTDACGTFYTEISFVNGNYISLNESDDSTCGAHPSGSKSSNVWRLDGSGDNPVAFSTVEGRGGSDEYAQAATHALMVNDLKYREEDPDPGEKVAPLGLGNNSEDQDIRRKFPNWASMSEAERGAAMQEIFDPCFPNHNDTGWFIDRKNGRWTALGTIDTGRDCNGTVTFDLPFNTPFAGPASTPISLDEIRKQVPDAYDAVWSPKKEMVVVLTGQFKRNSITGESATVGTAIEVFLPHGQDLDRPVVTLRTDRATGPVMAEWATGSNVTRWTAQLTKIKAQGLVKPLLSVSQQR